MTHTDFQIGDYVYHKGKIVKVDILTPSDLNLAVADEDGSNGALYKDIKPIPITPEILEMNGFEQRKEEPDIYDCGGYVSYIMGLRGYRMGGEDTCVVAYNKKYVHELQHALKLCGIDKEIIL